MDTNEKMLEQIGAFYKAKDELGDAGKHLTISLSRVCWLAKDEADKRAKLELANDYYARFDNVFTGPGEIESGAIAGCQGPDAGGAGTELLICTRTSSSTSWRSMRKPVWMN